ncbi:hypothetical protein PENTCL1PPCAC_17503, partial [Pristionchus entomophagus]
GGGRFPIDGYSRLDQTWSVQRESWLETREAVSSRKESSRVIETIEDDEHILLPPAEWAVVRKTGALFLTSPPLFCQLSVKVIWERARDMRTEKRIATARRWDIL